MAFGAKNADLDTIKQKLVELVAVQGPRPEIGWIGFAEEKRHKQGKLLAAMGNLTTKNMKPTAVKIKGESCRPKGNDHKPGGPSFCRKGKQGKTV